LSKVDRRWRKEKREKQQESTMTQLEKEHTTAQNGKVVYTAKTRTSGGRENGVSRSSDGTRLNISLPGIEREVARSLVDEADQLCPYSKATRGNIDVEINLV
jgi:organic hydroperoxide reductase OsmC/OhrA